MNTTSSMKLDLAQTKLDGLGPNIKAIISDEMRMYMIQMRLQLVLPGQGKRTK